MTAANSPITSSVESERRAHEPSMEEILASIRRIISEEEQDPPIAAGAPAAAAAPEAPSDADDDDVLELTNVVADEPPPRPRPSLVQPRDDIAFDSGPAPAPPPPREAEFDDEPPGEGLVADAVVDRAAHAFEALHRGIAISETPAGGSLEGLVRAMMKPLLKDWLDANLPGIVERVVREEVERVANRRR